MNLRITSNTQLNNIFFNDNILKYKFYLLKNTLFKKFTTESTFAYILVKTLDNPLREIEKLDLTT